MNTQNNNNRTEKKILILIAIFMGIFILGASIQILSNL
jgi:flagellar basal body-associated protein FliL